MGRFGPLTGRLPWNQENAPPREGVVAKVQVWIRNNCKPRKTINRRWSSYFWKHRAEGEEHFLLGRSREAGTWRGIGEYVAQGEFVVAALREGYRAVSYPECWPNAHLNMARAKPGRTSDE